MESIPIVLLAARADRAAGADAVLRRPRPLEERGRASVRSLCDLCVSALAFWAIGAAILGQSSNGFFGIALRLLLGWGGTPPTALFYATVVLIGTAVVGGSLAERSRFFPLCAAWAVLAGLVIPTAAVDVGRVARAARRRRLRRRAGAVHLAAGAFARWRRRRRWGRGRGSTTATARPT